MKRIIILIILLMNYNSYSATQEILATVDNTPITNQDLNQAIEIFKIQHNLEELPDKEILTKALLDNLVLHALLFNTAAKSETKVEPELIEQVIVDNFAKPQNITLQQFKNKLSQRKVSFKFLQKFIKAEILKSKLAHDALGSKIIVSKQDVNEILYNLSPEDIKVHYIEIQAEKNDKNLHKIKKLQKELSHTSCANINPQLYQEFATKHQHTNNLIDLSPKYSNELQNLDLNQVSNIIIEEDNYKILKLCQRDMSKIPEERTDQATMLIGNKKLMLETKRFINMLRKSAHIQYFK